MKVLTALLEKTPRDLHSVRSLLQHSCSSWHNAMEAREFSMMISGSLEDRLGSSWWYHTRCYGTHMSRSTSRVEGKKKSAKKTKKTKTKTKNIHSAPGTGYLPKQNMKEVKDPHVTSLPKNVDNSVSKHMPSGCHDTHMHNHGKPVYTYEGPFSSAVKKVKHLSLFSCFVTLSSCPVMLLLDPASLVEGAVATSMTARMSLAATLSTFGMGTTGLLHWFTYPYIHRMKYDGTALDIETATFLARKTVHRILLQEIEAGAPGSMHPLSTFRASGKIFYVDKDYVFDRELLSLLTGDKEDDPPDDDNDDHTP